MQRSIPSSETASPSELLDARRDTETARIRQVALDYIEGWYTGDAARMTRALHPRLAKRIFRQTRNGLRLDHMTARRLIARTSEAVGAGELDPRKEVSILDRFGDVASVRIDASRWVDYLHLARTEAGWRIINVLWQLRPDRAP